MSQIYKPKIHDYDSDHQPTKQYVQVVDRTKKKEILNLESTRGTEVVYEEDGKAFIKQHPKPQERIIIVQPTQPIQQKGEQADNNKSKEQQKKIEKGEPKQTKKRAFILDDRQRQKVKQVQRQQQKPSNDYRQQNDRNRQKKTNSKNWAQEDEQEGANKKEKKIKYVQKKPQSSRQEEKPNRSDKKHAEKNVSKIRRQQQYRNGQKFTVELIYKGKQHQNQIYINTKDVDQYVDLALQLLDSFKQIELKAFGQYVAIAFEVVGILQQEVSSLKQISIPSTVQVKEITKIGTKELSRGFITIELSLDSLDSKHIGYQVSSNKKSQYKEKQPTEKSSSYKQKPSTDKPSQFKEKAFNDRSAPYKQNSYNGRQNYRDNYKGERRDRPHQQRQVDERELR